MSLLPFPSTSGTKPSELHVYTIEECQSCKQKTKRDFKVGDYVTGDAGVCDKCQGKRMIILIYGEKVSKRRRSSRGNQEKSSVQGHASPLRFD